MPRVVFVSRVRREVLQQYREAHAAVWPEMLRALRDTGWKDYTLHLSEDGVLVGVADLDDYAAAQARMAATEVNARWQAEMAKHFGSDTPPDEGMVVLEKVFDLEEQLRQIGE